MEILNFNIVNHLNLAWNIKNDDIASSGGYLIDDIIDIMSEGEAIELLRDLHPNFDYFEA